MPKQKKIRVGVLFGGRSPEHEVSLVSAKNVISALDREKYEVVGIGITKEGKWVHVDKTLGLSNLEDAPRLKEIILSNNPQATGFYFLENNSPTKFQKLDVIFPVLHGVFGEDGSLQGLLELSGIPYVGCGVLASALGMDKSIQKQLLERAGFPVTPWVEIRNNEFKKDQDNIYKKIYNLSFPLFVKPANMGSSVGVHKVHNKKDLQDALRDAFRYDTKILAEMAVPAAREIECAVIGNDDPQTSILGEIKPANEFYDYHDKYINGKSRVIIPADLPKKTEELIRHYALAAFKILNCSGLTRVDFLLNGNSLKIYINEINTLPGFTSISMFPKLFEASGTKLSPLLDELIHSAFQKQKEKHTLLRSSNSETVGAII